MNEQWMTKAAWYELSASCFRYPQRETADALVDGEFAEAFRELAGALDFPAPWADEVAVLFASYRGADAEAVFHELRGENTRLFLVGADKPLVQPYAGVWHAQVRGRAPFLMVGQESMAIERFMGECGVKRPEGYGGPVDDMGTILEFLGVLCLRVADGEANGQPADTLQQLRDQYAQFYEQHFHPFAIPFAQGVLDHSASPAFIASARLLQALPAAAL